MLVRVLYSLHRHHQHDPRLFSGLAFAYVGADVGYVGWKSHKDGKPRMEVVRAVTQVYFLNDHQFMLLSHMLLSQELTFQTLASLLIPTVIIHTGVHQVFQFNVLRFCHSECLTG